MSQDRRARHRWSYDASPRLATERACLYCGLENRRRETGVTWRSSQVEARPPGGAWALVAEVPGCTSEDQVCRYYTVLAGRGT